MRIAFVNERMLLGFGVDLVIDEVATELVNRGHDVTVYANVADESVRRNYRLDRIPTRASGVPMRYEAAARWWAEYIDAHQHDIVFVESYPFFSLIPRLRTPAVAVDHGVSSTEGMSLRQRLAFRSIKRKQQGSYFPKACGIVTVSEYVRSLLPGRLRERARVIYNGADHYPAASAVERQVLRARCGIGDERVMMLYVGRLNPEGQPYKGTADLMRMAARWSEDRPEIAVVMAGRGDASDAARIRQSGAYPLLDVPEEDMAALYAAADIYLTASRWEGFDLPLMEAAHQGVPAVALNIGAHPEVVQDGETGILVSDVSGLAAAAAELAADAGRRRAIGEAARAWAQRFTWPGATDGYEEVVAGLVGPKAPHHVAASSIGKSAGGSASNPRLAPKAGTAPVSESGSPAVTAVILNYGASFEVLQRCIDSVAAQTTPVHILLIDNNSPKNRDAVDRILEARTKIELLQLKKNYGFAGGMNRGVDACRTGYVLLLNNDVTLAPNAAEEMLKLIEGREDVVGIAPKILLDDPPGYIDAIGNLVDGVGQAYNMGIGQLDIGQYDRVEPTFGACFAATLLRREAFRPGLVGPLDENYFMYYEDVDWCYRAGVLGYKFLICPSAVVQHAHSLTTRELAYGFKYRLIMRNFVRTLLKDFQGRRAYKLALRRCLGLSRNVVAGPHRLASLLALKDVGLSFPAYAMRRRAVQGRRKVHDQSLFNFSHGETGFFDPVSYTPVRTIDTLHVMYRRLYLLTGDDNHRVITAVTAALAATRLRFDREFVLSKLRPLVASEPPCVQEYVEQLQF